MNDETPPVPVTEPTKTPTARQPPPAEDRWAYRIAVGAVGVALVAFLIGAAVIAAGAKPIPTQYWATGSAISGALLGILAPTPTTTSDATGALHKIGEVLSDLWTNRALFMLMAVFGVSIAFAIARNSAPLETVAAAAGGALVGLLAPSPGQNPPE